jgi:hypothetical protein
MSLSEKIETRSRWALTLVLICVTSPACLAQNQAPSLTLIHPDDQDFETILTTNFPGLEELDGYTVFRPYLVLLRNNTLHRARAYGVEWETHSATGMVRRTIAHFVQRYNPALLTERKAFVPGELRLVSPEFDVSPTEYPTKRNWITTVMSLAPTHLPYRLTDTQSVVASVDAAIFDDGGYIGADRHQLLLRYQCQRDAERDMAAAVLQLLDKKASTADIVSLLEQEAHAGLAANTSQVNYDTVYALYRGREAQTFLTLYHREGMETVMTRARWLRSDLYD